MDELIWAAASLNKFRVDLHEFEVLPLAHEILFQTAQERRQKALWQPKNHVIRLYEKNWPLPFAKMTRMIAKLILMTIYKIHLYLIVKCNCVGIILLSLCLLHLSIVHFRLYRIVWHTFDIKEVWTIDADLVTRKDAIENALGHRGLGRSTRNLLMVVVMHDMLRLKHGPLLVQLGLMHDTRLHNWGLMLRKSMDWCSCTCTCTCYATISILGFEATFNICHTPHELLLIIRINCRPFLQILCRRVVTIVGLKLLLQFCYIQWRELSYYFSRERIIDCIWVTNWTWLLISSIVNLWLLFRINKGLQIIDSIGVQPWPLAAMQLIGLDLIVKATFKQLMVDHFIKWRLNLWKGHTILTIIFFVLLNLHGSPSQFLILMVNRFTMRICGLNIRLVHFYLF